MRPWSATFTPPQLDRRTLLLLCETLATMNTWFLQDTPGFPLLYAAGVRYDSDKDALEGKPETWRACPWVLAAARRGEGADCKQLAAWRVAELRARHSRPGVRCGVSSAWDGRRVVHHVYVESENGTVEEDPSAILGMSPALVGGLSPWNL